MQEEQLDNSFLEREKKQVCERSHKENLRRGEALAAVTKLDGKG